MPCAYLGDNWKSHRSGLIETASGNVASKCYGEHPVGPRIRLYRACRQSRMPRRSPNRGPVPVSRTGILFGLIRVALFPSRHFTGNTPSVGPKTKARLGGVDEVESNWSIGFLYGFNPRSRPVSYTHLRAHETG